MFRFDGRAPERARLVQALRTELGPRAERHFDGIGVQGDRVELTSIDPVALLYAAKVCQSLGGAAFLPGVPGDLHLPLPRWCERPWIAHGWMTRLKIRLGRIVFAPRPARAG
jgi:hypothetical protein